MMNATIMDVYDVRKQPHFPQRELYVLKGASIGDEEIKPSAMHIVLGKIFGKNHSNKNLIR